MIRCAAFGAMFGAPTVHPRWALGGSWSVGEAEMDVSERAQRHRDDVGDGTEKEGQYSRCLAQTSKLGSEALYRSYK